MPSCFLALLGMFLAIVPRTSSSAELAVSPVVTATLVCSGHGIRFHDDDELCDDASVREDEILSCSKERDRCRCFQCYEGASCSTLTKQCAIDTRVAELTLTRPWWDRRSPYHARRGGLTTTRHMKYLGNSRLFLASKRGELDDKNESASSPPQPRNPVSEHLNHAIRSLHRAVGNVRNEHEYNLVIGSGGVQMLNAAMFAMHKKIERREEEDDKDEEDDAAETSAYYYAKKPYYSHFRVFAAAHRGTMKWLDDEDSARQHENNDLVEIVTSPNNPDGRRCSAPFVVARKDLLIHDHVYHWPSILDPDHDQLEVSEELMVFSLAKLTGHAASRIGWALVKDPQVAKDMATFIWIQSTHAAVEAQFGAIRILRTVIASLGKQNDDDDEMSSIQSPAQNEEDEKNFFTFTRRELMRRWAAVEIVLNDGDASPLVIESVGHRGGLCLWFRCHRRHHVMNTSARSCASEFRDVGIIAETGESFGAGSDHARVCISSDRSTFALILHRLRRLIVNLKRGGEKETKKNWICTDCQDHHVHF